MAKTPTQSFMIIKELLECLVHYADHLTEPPSDAEILPDRLRKPITYRFVIDSPEQKTDAILKLLFGEDVVNLKRGAKGFRDTDKQLMLDMKAEMFRTGNTKEELIDKYVEIAQMRSPETHDESIRSRLEDVYYSLAHASENQNNYDEYSGMGFENYIEDELRILQPWLIKYRHELINLLAT